MPLLLSPSSPHLESIQFNVNSRQSISTSNSHHLIIAARFRIIRRRCVLSVPTTTAYCIYIIELMCVHAEHTVHMHMNILCSDCRRRAAVHTIHLRVFLFVVVAVVVCIHRSPRTPGVGTKVRNGRAHSNSCQIDNENFIEFFIVGKIVSNPFSPAT